MSHDKSILIVNRKAPYGSAFAKESLDVGLIAAAFGQKLGILFMDDGVYQLLKHQDPSEIQQKNSSQTLPMLEMYDVKDIYVEAESLQARNLDAADLLIPVEVISSQAISELLEQQDILLNF
ncbi:MAG: sulfurtransferase complex subunit TusC [Pseudomonadales bacterium]|jgi:tRNA 2-thiouridine synthesizing protein C